MPPQVALTRIAPFATITDALRFCGTCARTPKGRSTSNLLVLVAGTTNEWFVEHVS
jgi:hypothetical protein